MVINKAAADAIAPYVEGERQIDADAWYGTRALFLPVPLQAKKGDDTLKGRISSERFPTWFGKSPAALRATASISAVAEAKYEI